MAEPKKKTATKKTSSSQKTAPKKSPSKKTTAAPKKSTAPKKTTATPATKTVAKPATKKAPAPKKTAVKTPVKKATPVSSKKQLVPESVSTKKSITDMSIFATILAVFVVALVVLGGYIYSRQARMLDETRMPNPVVSEPQRISISSTVVLTPEIMSTLESLVTQIAIAPEEVLLDVRKIENVALAQSESPDFFVNVLEGDFVFGFKSTSVLFRPSTRQIINTGILPKN